MSGWPTFHQLKGFDPDGLAEIIDATDLPSGVFPLAPANGTAVCANKGQFGALRIVPAALTGDGSKTQFTINHKLGSVPTKVWGFQSQNGLPGGPVEVNYAPSPGATTSATLVVFPAAPAAGVTYLLAVLG